MQGALGEEDDLLARIVGKGVQTLMAAERDVQVGADRFERTGVRRTQRLLEFPPSVDTTPVSSTSTLHTIDRRGPTDDVAVTSPEVPAAPIIRF
jgi:hypothetical protein